MLVHCFPSAICMAPNEVSLDTLLFRIKTKRIKTYLLDYILYEMHRENVMFI